MGLWQNLVESYLANEGRLKKIYPLSTTTINNANSPIIVVAISAEGVFLSAREIPKKGSQDELQTFVIPVTESSMGRSGRDPCPHPLCDQYAYLGGDEKYYKRYLQNIPLFQDISVEFKAVYRYVERRTVVADVEKFSPNDKTMILFEVETPGVLNPRLWENEELLARWHQCYTKMHDVICTDMVSGERVPCAVLHPRKVTNTAGNAKLISCNDDKNFTFRGRFNESHEAFSVGYESSQRAHQFLRYIINERGIVCDSQVIVSFAVAKEAGGDASLPAPPVSENELPWDELDDGAEPSESEGAVNLAAETGENFGRSLAKALAGYKLDPVLKAGAHDSTVVLILDAATEGRLSVTFYREMTREEYLEKLVAWHEECQWHFVVKRKEAQREKGRFYEYVGAPSVDSIIETVYGRPRNKDKGYNTIKKRARETLIRCIFDNSPFPRNYLVQAIRRASDPRKTAVLNENEKFNKDAFLRNLSVVCALINKSLKDERKESYDMSLETTRTDRDYLYGRLLGAADKLEEYALWKGKKERAETAALRYMQVFSQRPFTTWNTIHSTLAPYIPKVRNSIAYAEVQRVYDMFLPRDYEDDTPLSGAYLIGYYCERAYIEQTVCDINNKAKEEEVQ